MNILKTTVISLVAAAVVVVAGFSIYHPVNTIVENQTSPANQTIVRGTSPEFSSPYIKVNGVTQWFSTVAMTPASTTLCAFQAPAGTSTLEYVAWNIFQGTSTSALIDIGTGKLPTGYTTELAGGTSVGSGAQGSLLYSSSASSTNATSFSSNPNSQFNQYLNVTTEGAGLGGYTFGGQCTAVFDAY